MKLQNAMEFMMTYGWAILIIMIVIATLYSLGIFNPTTPNVCALPANIGCVTAFLAHNGLLTVNLEQATPYTINIIGIGCNSNGGTNTIAPPPVSPTSAVIPVGGNMTFFLYCSTSLNGATVTYNAPIGTTYTGYIIVNYTDVGTGFQHTASGTLIQKVTS